MNSVTNSINTLSNSSTCALCNDPTTSLFGGRSVVTASCSESHQFHFDCIVQPLLDQAKAEAKRSELHCLVCSEQPVLPLLRGSQPLAEHACRYGDLEALGKMLDLDIDNIGWQQSGGAIYADNLESRMAVLGKIAAKHGQVECLQLLWEKSKGPNPEPDSVLYTAAANGRIDCLEWVLSTWFKEHHRDYVTEKLNKAMCSAAREGQVESMRYLMKKGANEAAGALRIASQRCQTDSIRFLVKSWYCFEDLNSGRRTEILNESLMIASAKNQPESVQVLLNEGGLVLSLDLNYALFNAVGSGSIQCMQPLIDAGADINGRFEKGCFLTNGFTPLTWSVSRQDKELMNAVMLAGANVDVKNQFGDCALHIAAGLNDITYLRKLLEFAADRNARDQQGRTALHLGNRTDNVACAETLIRAGADINARDCSGETALFAAVKKNNIGYIMALIDANADINVKNNRNQTALEFASDVQCRRVLIGAGAMYSWQLELLDVAEALEDLNDLLCTLI
ncbi:ankyrin repeat domain-containing protein [Endozoicomonas sp. YOMI1]|uniref:ankyrin repeat domain-containing protein n=1 Tax=Endozoicomonas sp. YOMI1 TaxID=2828739 RepID=UPI002148F9E6|nr:ankyrin repeat domain-containing protein [Endozoicomonas sp. YOMI1]